MQLYNVSNNIINENLCKYIMYYYVLCNTQNIIIRSFYKCPKYFCQSLYATPRENIFQKYDCHYKIIVEADW